MWIKICGITTIEDAQFAARAGADAVGFVFAESPRQVTAVRAAAIARELPDTLEKIGVFVDAGPDVIEATVRAVRLTGVQLYGPVNGKNSHEDSCGLVKTIRARLDDFERGLRVVLATHFDGDAAGFARELAAMHGSGAVDAILVDSRTGAGRAAAQGGTGIAFDWKRASAGFLDTAPRLRLIAAGGLRPENVDMAIRTLRPWGVDVSSGVESAPGRKDPERVAAFVRAARAAAMEIERAGSVVTQVSEARPGAPR